MRNSTIKRLRVQQRHIIDTQAAFARLKNEHDSHMSLLPHATHPNPYNLTHYMP